jgi:hypothetical protein
LQGVVLLWSPTGWPLSLIVLFASIMIPSAKIVALAYLLISTQRGSIKNNDQRIRLYRMVEFIGRWSMVANQRSHPTNSPVCCRIGKVTLATANLVIRLDRVAL